MMRTHELSPYSVLFSATFLLDKDLQKVKFKERIKNTFYTLGKTPGGSLHEH